MFCEPDFEFELFCCCCWCIIIIAAILCCLAWDKNSKASIERTRGIGETLSGESSSDVEDEELLLANLAALLPLSRFGL